MKLSKLKVTELASLCYGAEKLSDNIARHIKANHTISSEANKHYMLICGKHNKILAEINKRLMEIEDE